MEITEKEYNKLLHVITELKEENRKLHERVERLESELRKYKNENTPSSMTPPFLKGLEKKVDKEIKNAEKKEDDQQPKYNARNSRPEADKIDLHEIKECPNCGNPLRKRKRTFKRIVIDIKNIETETTEHISETGYCDNCKEVVKADVPNTLPNMKYGINVISLISVMSIGMNSTTSAIASFLNYLGLQPEVVHCQIPDNPQRGWGNSPDIKKPLWRPVLRRLQSCALSSGASMYFILVLSNGIACFDDTWPGNVAVSSGVPDDVRLGHTGYRNSALCACRPWGVQQQQLRGAAVRHLRRLLLPFILAFA